MAKLANGMADGLLTSVVRAWDAWGDLDGDVAAVVGGGARHRLVDGSERPRRRKRVLVAPAMNTAMWRHPVTARHLGVLEGQWGVYGSKSGGKKGEEQEEEGEQLERRDGDNAEVAENENADGWFEVLQPKSKALACGDVGDGAMMEWTNIVAVIEERLGFGQ